LIYCVSDFTNRRKRQISTSIHVDGGHYFIETYTNKLIISYALMFHIFLLINLIILKLFHFILSDQLQKLLSWVVLSVINCNQYTYSLNKNILVGHLVVFAFLSKHNNTLFVTNFRIAFAMLVYLVCWTYCKICYRF